MVKTMKSIARELMVKIHIHNMS